MVRYVACLLVVCVGGLVLAQTKDKKDKEFSIPKEAVKAKVVSVDTKKSVIVLEMPGGKKVEHVFHKEVKVWGPMGGKATIKDKRLKGGVMVHVVVKDGKVMHLYLPRKEVIKKEVIKEKKD